MLLCDLCCNELTYCAYTVPGSERGAKVYICNHCGLVQTAYEKYSHSRMPSISSGATWGNLRYSKELLGEEDWSFILQNVPVEQIRSAMDIGANRGWMLQRLLTLPNIRRITAVEPDHRVVGDWYHHEKIFKVLNRLEKVAFWKDEKYDFIYCSHTLEHADSATEMLGIAEHLLNGYLFLEVPNIAVIDRPDNVTEFFIDKHAFHFDADSLRNCCMSVGLEVAAEQVDEFNIRFLCRKAPTDLCITNAFEENRSRIARYAEQLPATQQKLVELCKQWNQLEETAIFGGHNILHALVTIGGLDLQRFVVIDDYVAKYMPTFNGHPIQTCEQVDWSKVKKVLVLARLSAQKIINKLKLYGDFEVIEWNASLRALLAGP